MAKNIHALCSQCGSDTNHNVLYCKRVTSDFSDENELVILHEDFMVVQCKGCDSVSFLKRDSGDLYANEDGSPDYEDSNFPETRIHSRYSFLNHEEINLLPSTLYSLYEQVSVAFDHDANMLAGVGLRMLVEGICNEQSIEGRTLQPRIERLHEKGLISKNEVPILHKLRDIGNTSAHEIKGLSMDKLTYALSIINHALRSIYILPKINKKLRLEPIKKPFKNSSIKKEIP